MCIIIAKPEGIDMPSDKILDNCQNANKDGIGIAWADGSEAVHIKKDFDTLWQFKVWLAQNVTKDDACIIHYRIATSGLVDYGNRHPFPVAKNVTRLREVESDSDLAVAHNGILSQWATGKKYSDTMNFITKILADETVKNNIDSPIIQELICGYIDSSKLAFIKPDKSILLLGEFIKDEEIAYSNYGFRDYSKPLYDKDWYKENYSRRRGACGSEITIPDSVLGGELICSLCEKETPRKKMVVVSLGEDGYYDDDYYSSEYMCRTCYYKQIYGVKGVSNA